MALRHGAILGLCAFVTAFPHSVPDFVPPLLVYLGSLLHDQQPIPGKVMNTSCEFSNKFFQLL